MQAPVDETPLSLVRSHEQPSTCAPKDRACRLVWWWARTSLRVLSPTRTKLFECRNSRNLDTRGRAASRSANQCSQALHQEGEVSQHVDHVPREIDLVERAVAYGH